MANAQIMVINLFSDMMEQSEIAELLQKDMFSDIESDMKQIDKDIKSFVSEMDMSKSLFIKSLTNGLGQQIKKDLQSPPIIPRKKWWQKLFQMF